MHKFHPQGVTGVIILAESHISIHTWPEEKYAAIDIFMCGDTKPKLSVEYINRKFQPKKYTLKEIERKSEDEKLYI